MEPRLQDIQNLRVAVEGCGHGTLNAIYTATETACKARGWSGVDLLIIGGDFQAVRNLSDLTVMSVPEKFREIGDFHEYYSGTRRAPYLTLFVGGNHEASSHLFELYYGGWVAPNIYYMGAANVLRLGPIRIAGLSGIWKGYNYKKSHHERLPYNQDDIKSIYHVREVDVRKLLQLRTQVDIGISHDWPRAIEKFGDEKFLFRIKPAFEQESKEGTLGNQAAAYVMDRLRPPYWFAAHMHCKFAATRTYEDVDESAPQATLDPVQNNSHTTKGSNILSHADGIATHNTDEIDLDIDDEISPPVAKATDLLGSENTEEINLGDEENATPSVIAAVPEHVRSQLPEAFARPVAAKQVRPGQPTPAAIRNKSVRFLALDKCLPGRKFLQLLDIVPYEVPKSPEAEAGQYPRYQLSYDPEWLAITRVFAPSLVVGDRSAVPPPDLGEEHYRPLIEAEEAWVNEHIVKAGKLFVPENFVVTAPVHSSEMQESRHGQPREYNNPQTVTFCELLGIDNPFSATDEEREARVQLGPAPEERKRDARFDGRGRGRWVGNRGPGRGRGRGTAGFQRGNFRK